MNRSVEIRVIPVDEHVNGRLISRQRLDCFVFHSRYDRLPPAGCFADFQLSVPADHRSAIQHVISSRLRITQLLQHEFAKVSCYESRSEGKKCCHEAEAENYADNKDAADDI